MYIYVLWNNCIIICNILFEFFFYRNDYCYWFVDIGVGNFLNISILVIDDEYGMNFGGFIVYDGLCIIWFKNCFC